MKAKIGIVVTIFVVVCASSFVVWNSGLAGNRDAKEVAKVESGMSVTEGSTTTVQEPQEIVVEIKFRENFDKEDVIDDFIAKKIEGSKIKVLMFNEYGENYYTKEVICRNGQYECNGESYKYFLRVTGRNLNAAHNGGLLILCNRKISYEEYWSHVYDSNHNPDEWIKHEVIGDYVYY